MRIDVFYAEGGEHFFVNPARCAAAHPGQLVRRCSPQRAARLGLTWEPDDRAERRALQSEVGTARLRSYRTDPRTGVVRKIDG